MFGIKVKITKFIYDWQPGWVECEFVDAFGKLQVFNDKIPIFTSERLDKNSIYPQDGIIACEIVEQKSVNNSRIIKVDTEKPWHIESKEGETVFEILETQILEFEHI